MAKRAAANEEPYRPLLDMGLVAAAAKPVSTLPPIELLPEAKVREVFVDGPSSGRTAISRETEPAKYDLREVASPASEKLDQEKRILFTKAENQALDRLVNSLASRLNTQVKASHVFRALANLLLHAEAAVDKRAGELGPLSRPPNGDVRALQRFERSISTVIAAALRDAGPLRD